MHGFIKIEFGLIFSIEFRMQEETGKRTLQLRGINGEALGRDIVFGYRK